VAEEKVPVMIRKEIYEKAKKFIEESGGFESVEEFVEYLIEEAIEIEESGEALTKEDQEKVSERLRDLGYL